MENTIPISVSIKKNFIVAKTTVEKSKLVGGLFHKPVPIEKRAGYDLYCYVYKKDNRLVLQKILADSTSDGTRTIIDWLSVSNIGKKDLPDFVTILWVKSGSISISVPWGLADKEIENVSKRHGEVKVACDAEKIIRDFADTIWESETAKDGITYEYLSEYFVIPDSEEKQYGLSIEFRKILLPLIKELLKSGQELNNNNLKELLRKSDVEVQSLVDCVSIVGGRQ